MGVHLEVLAQLPVLEPIAGVERGHVDGKSAACGFDLVRIGVDLTGDFVPPRRRVVHARARLDRQLAGDRVLHYAARHCSSSVVMLSVPPLRFAASTSSATARSRLFAPDEICAI